MPHTAAAEDLRRFQIEQQEAGMPVPKMNSIVAALRFFSTHLLNRPELARKLVLTVHARKILIVLTFEEMKRLSDATTCLKHQAALSVAYGSGLRVAEVFVLKVRDVDSERMLLRVERGKGGRYRHAMLPKRLLVMLRDWWHAGRQQGVLHANGFLLHALPKGFHRIRHYGLLANGTRKDNLESAGQLLTVAPPAADAVPVEPTNARAPCPC